MKKTLNVYNGQTRGDGYDAHMRPVRPKDNAPGGVTHVVTYIPVGDGNNRVLYCYSEEDARHAALYGPAADGDVA